MIALNILAFTVVRFIFEAFESDLEFIAVTEDSGKCGSKFTHKGVTKKIALSFLGIFKWLNLFAAIFIYFFYMERQDNDKKQMNDRIDKEVDAKRELLDEPTGISTRALETWNKLRSSQFVTKVIIEKIKM